MFHLSNCFTAISTSYLSLENSDNSSNHNPRLNVYTINHAGGYRVSGVTVADFWLILRDGNVVADYTSYETAAYALKIAKMLPGYYADSEVSELLNKIELPIRYTNESV